MSIFSVRAPENVALVRKDTKERIPLEFVYVGLDESDGMHCWQVVHPPLIFAGDHVVADIIPAKTKLMFGGD